MILICCKFNLSNCPLNWYACLYHYISRIYLYLEAHTKPGKQKSCRNDVPNVGVIQHHWKYYKIWCFYPASWFSWNACQYYAKISDKKKCIDSVLLSYSRKYPAVSVSPTIIAILNQPQIAISEKFRDEAATAFFLRACYKLKNDIRTLKTMAAKQRRYIQAAELADVIIDRLKSNVRQRYIDCINNELSNIANLIASQPTRKPQ